MKQNKTEKNYRSNEIQKINYSRPFLFIMHDDRLNKSEYLGHRGNAENETDNTNQMEIPSFFKESCIEGQECCRDKVVGM